MGTRLQCITRPYYFKGHIRRNSAAGELLPEVPTALKQRCFFTVTMLFWESIFLSCLPGAVPQEACLEFTELGGGFGDESRNFKIGRRNNKNF